MVGRGELTETAWAAIAPLLPAQGRHQTRRPMAGPPPGDQWHLVAVIRLFQNHENGGGTATRDVSR